MLSKTPKANRSVTESAPKRKLSKKYIPFVVVIVFIAVSAGLFMIRHAQQDGASRNNQGCTMLSSEQAAEEVCIDLEVVQSRQELIRGLSGRESLQPNEGMLFDFQSEGEHCMWMKDMNFSLDMIWLDASGEVVDTKTNIHPNTYPDQVFCNKIAPAQYVIEVANGIVESANVTRGQQIEF